MKFILNEKMFSEADTFDIEESPLSEEQRNYVEGVLKKYNINADIWDCCVDDYIKRDYADNPKAVISCRIARAFMAQKEFNVSDKRFIDAIKAFIKYTNDSGVNGNEVVLSGSTISPYMLSAGYSVVDLLKIGANSYRYTDSLTDYLDCCEYPDGSFEKELTIFKFNPKTMALEEYSREFCDEMSIDSNGFFNEYTEFEKLFPECYTDEFIAAMNNADIEYNNS